MDLKIAPEQLQQHSEDIIKQTNHIRELIANIEKAMDTLAGWNSESKIKFVEEVKVDIQDIKSMVEAAESYGLVAGDVSARVLGVENSIKNMINQQYRA